MTLRDELEQQRHRSLGGIPAGQLAAVAAYQAEHRASVSIASPAATETIELCTCGQPVDPDLISLRAIFPSAYRPFCADCYEAAALQDEEAAAAEREASEQARRAAEVPKVIDPEILDTRLNHPGFNPPLHIAVQGWTPESGRWLVIHGDPATCKTRCVALLARRLILQGHLVRWCRATDFQTTCEELWIKDPSIQRAAYQRLRDWASAGILVIDDLGKNTWSALLEAKLFDLIDTRQAKRRPTIVTANTRLEDLVPELSAERGGPLIGRILESARGYIIRAVPPRQPGTR
jgi:DNA replication protein DnaC